MKIGTRSVLYGAHCFFIHPFFVALAWWKLYGFPRNPRLWAAFFVHDLGYWGKPNMDGLEGETHVLLGADIMGKLFGPKWYSFTLFHSRYYAKLNNTMYSELCVADKLAVALEPWWFYLPRVILTGEIREYMDLHINGKYAKESRRGAPAQGRLAWCKRMQQYCREWAYAHRDLKEDLWTPPR